MSKDLKKDILKYIIFTVCLVFGFIYIKPIWHFLVTIINLFMPFILGLVMAFVLNVLVNFLERKIFKSKEDKKTHYISIILALAIVISVISLILVLIIPQIKNTANIFVDNLPEYQENVIKILDNIGVNDEVRANIIDRTKNFSEKASSYVKNNSGILLDNILGIASNLLSSIVNLGIGLVFAIYLLIYKKTLLRQVNKVLNAYLKESKVEKIHNVASLSNRTFANFVSGQVTEAFIIGVLCFVGMLILRIPYVASISILVGFTALIPVFGAFIGTIIGAFLIFMVNPLKALIFIIFIIILQQFEGNLIYPKVVGKSVNLPSIWVLVAVTIGASISGVVGMLVSVPVCSIFYSIMATNVNSRLNLKKKKKHKTMDLKNTP